MEQIPYNLENKNLTLSDITVKQSPKSGLFMAGLAFSKMGEDGIIGKPKCYIATGHTKRVAINTLTQIMVDQLENLQN